jgi:outer membrane protein OmpA-like peptidoglycan-associated protein
MEFDLAGAGNGMVLYFDGRSAPHERGSADGGEHLAFGSDFAALNGPTRSGSSANTGRDTKKEVVRARIMADGEYVKVFVNERRVVNVPNAKLGRTKQIYVGVYGWSAEAPRMIGDVRIAAGGRKLYDALAEKGRVATQGVLFATASAEVRPESGPTLKEIAAMLAEHPELKLTIEGHTDNAGDAAANQALSQARAEAVKQALVAGYGVGRRAAGGPGASAPASRPRPTPRPRAAPPTAASSSSAAEAPRGPRDDSRGPASGGSVTAGYVRTVSRGAPGGCAPRGVGSAGRPPGTSGRDRPSGGRPAPGCGGPHATTCSCRARAAGTQKAGVTRPPRDRRSS